MLTTAEKYCPTCKAKAEAKFKGYSNLYEQARKVWDEQYRKFYNSQEWRTFRLEVLKGSPFCQCGKFGSACHHVEPLKDNWERRLDPTNIVTMCSSCHASHELQERNKGKK
jgi:5-methylcytosine-specific restriction protein A